ncbi:NAD(P)-binding protein [Phellopilus nigrolimitatus]|nr:NAD(P)-binding protein [Phellopilus nigrolimitatus]
MSESSPAQRTILVVGATGKQGRSFVSAMLSTGSAVGLRVLALTRSAASAGARGLSGVERVVLAEADLDKPDTLRRVFEDEKARGEGGVWGVFMVLAFPGLGADASGEERQGKLVADLALEYGVQHFVFSSVERGGEGYDDQLTLDRHAKVQIERHIKSLDGLHWTILRPAFFMENFDGTIGRITATVLRVGLQKDTKLQLIAADDIGHVALAVFQAPDAHTGKAITVVGDALTPQEIADAYARGAGQALPGIPALVARTLLAMNKHTKGLIADIERVNRDRAAHSETNEDLIAQCRGLYPGMQTMEDWARARGSRKNRQKDWNKVSVGELVQGKR